LLQFYFSFASTEVAVSCDRSENINITVLKILFLHRQPVFFESDMQANKSTRPILKKAADDHKYLSESEQERQCIDAEYELIHAKVMAEMQIDHLEPLATEAEILAAAIRITKRK
jgi:hypothetical protein